jgi:polyribonucleotide nucleotidyltransferase
VTNDALVKVSREFGPLPITMEVGKVARFADGAVMVTYGETMVLVTVVSRKEMSPGQNFLPLQVEYRERAAAAGKIPGSYFRREGRPTEKEILVSRMTDRPLRPLFPKGYFYETQVLSTLFSADGQNDPDILSINGASAALMISDIPFHGPMGAVRIGRVEGKWVVNPTHREREFSDMDLVYVGTKDQVLMIEGSALELPDEEFNQALEFAQAQIQPVLELQWELVERVGKLKRQVELFQARPEVEELFLQSFAADLRDALFVPRKKARDQRIEEVLEKWKVLGAEKLPETSAAEMEEAFWSVARRIFREEVLRSGRRCDGRGPREIRSLYAETGIFPRAHGSALFSRGETQVVCLTTLASMREAQELDAYGGGESTKRFILHYNFPPFSTGEVRRITGQSRREVGHGALAERSLAGVIPSEVEFPYAIRVTAEVLESNGSTSMASVCGGTLSLMDAGVALKSPVAGISIGLLTEYQGDRLERYLLLTDIVGDEDHLGDMDFKLAGTRKGVTGFQLDLKLPGVPVSLLQEAVQRAREARLQILEFMQNILNEPRKELSRHAPRIETIKIHPDKIGLLIGPGGKTIKQIAAQTGAEINVEDDGTVMIYCPNAEGMALAREMIEDLTGEIVVGEIYRGRVVGVKDFGCFVEIKGKGEGLVHISELADVPVRRVEDVVRMGDEIWVKCIGIDDRGRIKLSRKAALRDRRLATPPASPR